MNCDLVSIYLPTFNRVDLLKRAVSSVLEQSYENIELLIVDDGSDDGTTSYLEKLTSEDSRVRVLEKNGPKGAPASRNTAIENATGKYITGLDDDDYIEFNHIELLFSKYVPSVSCVFSRRYNWKDLVFSPVCYLAKRVHFRQLLYFNIIGNQVFTETWKLKKIGGFDGGFPALQDYDTWLRLVKEFGPAKMIVSNSYNVDTAHGAERITDDWERRVFSFCMLEKKHVDECQRAISNSFCLRKYIISNGVAGDIRWFYFFNPMNFRIILSMTKKYINITFNKIF